MDFVLDLSSLRARKSRYFAALNRKWVGIVLQIVSALSVLGSLYLLALQGSPLGWVAMLPAALSLNLYLWKRGDLDRIDYGKYASPPRILLHEALEPTTLARLKRGNNLSAYDIWKALEKSEEHFFVSNRFLIGSDFFENLMDRNAGSAQAVWQNAEGLHNKHQTQGYDNMLLITALILSVPSIDQLLRSVQLETSDIETSIPWMADIHEKRRLVKAKKFFGGIGRDWAYGYTPILRSLGHNISESIERYGFFSDTRMHQRIVQQVLQEFSNGKGSVALVGDTGVGKTTCVYALAETLLVDPSLPKNVRYHQIVEMDASALIANAKHPGEMEELMIHILNEAHRAKNIILFFDEAEAFFGSGIGSVDLSRVLQPAFESATIRIILAMRPQAWQKLTNTSIAARLQPVNVSPADRDTTLAVLRDQIATIEYRHKVVFTYQALQESYKLGSRYVTTQVMPGAALSVLEQAATSTSEKLITRQTVQQSVEQTYGIKLQQAGGQESTELLNLEDKLHQYLINQSRAVTVVSNALRRSRSGVGNPDRPIGTFLFLGPTGVGKTELSKALARVYFGNEKALIRVDMNQYVQSEDLKRLLTPMSGEQLGFLGEVRRQPFSVILLDEIEKAHNSVINALLQMLDEGVMRDSDNKAVSFKDAIIIATSNAGADEIRKLIGEGKNIEELEATFVDTLIQRGDFAPEFVNRFDEVVLFRPLTQDELVQVVDLIVAGINKTLDPQKVKVELTDQAKRWLVEKGYDSKLGARPMRRMAQRYVENIIAKRLLEKSAHPGSVISLDVPDFEKVE